MKRLFALLLTCLAAPAGAFTPESGWWWNPGENGRGFNIEIQDDVAVISAYVYDPNGEPAWFLAVGTLKGYAFDPPRPFLNSSLDRFENGQCILCPYDGPPDEVPGAGSFRIDFHSPTTATITWRDGSTTPIQRHNFLGYSQRQNMLGEWQMVVDFSSQTDDGLAFWAGDALSFDAILTDREGDYYAGYRKHSAADRSGNSDDLGDAAGDFIRYAGSRPGSRGVHTIVVDNSSDPDERWLAYYLTVGTNSFEGIAEVYCDADEVSNCDGATGRGVPVRGWRSASQEFVDTGEGPAKAGDGSGDGAGLRVPPGASLMAGTKSVADLTGDAKAAEQAVAAARRLTDALRREPDRN